MTKVTWKPQGSRAVIEQLTLDTREEKMNTSHELRSKGCVKVSWTHLRSSCLSLNYLVCWKIALYHSFLWLIFHCMHNMSVFIHSPIYGHLRWFPCLCYCTLCYYKHCCAYHFSDGSFHLTGYMTSSVIVGSYSNCIFRVLENSIPGKEMMGRRFKGRGYMYHMGDSC